MLDKMKTGLFRTIARNERGQVFIMVLLLMLLGGLIIPPLLAFTGTSIKSGQVFERKSDELYAADAGIEDGIWQIKYYDMGDDPDNRFPGYDPYAYYEHSSSYSWQYDLSDEPGELNDKDVQVDIENDWIPKDITVPSKPEANAIVSAGNFIVTGSVSGANTYRIRISYTKAEGADDGDVPINKIGVWLPPGYEYVEGSSNLEQLLPSYAGHPDSVVVTNPYKGGEAVEWNFNGDLLNGFPPGTQGDQPVVRELTFQYTGGSESPTALSWVKTGNYEYLSYNYTWDSDIKVYKITSTAGDTTLEAYTTKTEIRHLSSAIAGDYYATGNSLLTPTGDVKFRDRLYEESSATVNTVLPGAEGGVPGSAKIEAAYLYWSGWIDWHNYEPSAGGDTEVFYDNCNDLITPPVNWSAGSRWTSNNGEFRGRGGGSSATDRTITMSGNVNLSSYSSQMVTISWKQHSSGLGSSDIMYFAFSGDGGGHWSSDIEAIHGDIGSSATTFGPYQIPSQYLTSNFRLKFSFNFTSSSKYVYVDDIVITASTAIFSEKCDNFSSPPVAWSAGSRWTSNNGEFQGQGGSTQSAGTLTMNSSVDLSAYQGKTLTISWEQRESGSLSTTDYLYFAFSGNGGGAWSEDFVAFHDDNPDPTFSYTIPSQYLTNNFRMRFYLTFSDNSKYAYIDNIAIFRGGGGLIYPSNPTQENLTTLVEETARVNTVMFNDVQITADTWKVLATSDDSEHNYQGTWSYNCVYDATDLVQQWIENETLEPNGTGTYTLGHVAARNEEDPNFSFSLYPAGTTGYPLGTPAYKEGGSYPTRHNYCYAGWSLILIYSSPDTKGHQLYLYDIQNPKFSFSEAWFSDPDFDGDGQPGGSIGGFLVPEKPAEMETPEDYIAAHITAFVGEGDSGIQPEYFKFNSTNLSNDQSPVGNVWNSRSPGLTIPGVDIDTFKIRWDQNLIFPQDTQASINMPTGDQVPPYSGDSDGFLLIYLILSFRSETTTGGTLGYLIR